MSNQGILQVTSELMASRLVNPSPTQLRVERGLRFSVGDAFYRSESGAGRDLSVLAAIAYKREHGELRAMDAMCGCGVRAMRYLAQAGADYVWANDACEQLRSCIVDNLQSVEVDELQQAESSSKWRVTSEDANKVLLGCYIREEYFDLIDVDSHGGNSVFLGSALAALKHGGLVYVTSTDGFSCSKRPYNALASYGAFTRRLPFTNEIGLRMLIGGVVREGATRNMRVLPLFSHYASHGPVFRIMLRMERGKLDLSKSYGFVGHCEHCGSWQSISWDDIGQTSTSPCCESIKVKYTGPIWTGPLHSRTEVEKLVQLAKELEWIAPPGSNKKKLTSETARLTEVLDVMLEESDPALPCGYLGLQEIASRGKVQTPRREDLTRYLRKEGYAVSRSQIEPNAIKTNASVAECIRAARRMFEI